MEARWLQLWPLTLLFACNGGEPLPVGGDGGNGAATVTSGPVPVVTTVGAGASGPAGGTTGGGAEQTTVSSVGSSGSGGSGGGSDGSGGAGGSATLLPSGPGCLPGPANALCGGAGPPCVASGVFLGQQLGITPTSLALDGACEPHIVFGDAGDVVLQRKSASGFSFDQRTISAYDVTNVALATDALGQDHLLVVTNGTLRAFSVDVDGHWTTGETLATGASLHQEGTVVDGAGVWRAVYAVGEQVVVAERTANGWVTQPIASTSGAAPVMVLSQLGEPHILYTSPAHELMWTTIGGTPEVVSALAVAGARIGVGPATPDNPKGQPHVVAIRDTGDSDEAWYFTRETSGQWERTQIAQGNVDDPPCSGGAVYCASHSYKQTAIGVAVTSNEDPRFYLHQNEVLITMTNGMFDSDIYGSSIVMGLGKVASYWVDGDGSGSSSAQMLRVGANGVVHRHKLSGFSQSSYSIREYITSSP